MVSPGRILFASIDARASVTLPSATPTLLQPARGLLFFFAFGAH